MDGGSTNALKGRANSQSKFTGNKKGSVGSN